MRFSARLRYCVVLGALIFFGRAGAAQVAPNVEAGRPNATREELTRLAAEADAAASVGAAESVRDAKRVQAAAVRERLREGDFRAGDRIVLAVQGDSAWTDTLVVLPGSTLRIVSAIEDSLAGVLRSELQSHLSAVITRYYKNATVRAIPLIPFGVLGEVARPGYYRLPADIAVSDAIMTAGGPTQRADMPRTIVRRRSRELLSRSAVRDALAAGLTLDQLGLTAGDELIVGAKPERGWQTAVQVGSLVTGVLLALRAAKGF